MILFSARNFILLFFLLLFSNYTNAQTDHWETVVFAEDEWQYLVGQSDYPTDWFEENFDDSDWQTGNGGFGYGDGDDGTNIPFTLSVALRKTFDITDLTKITGFVLSADYDDGFVAYLNGIEIARANMGVVGIPTSFDAGTFTDHEATLQNGNQPEYFYFPITADFLQNGENTLAIQVNNVAIFSSDLTSNFYLSLGINDESNDYEPNPNWFVPPFEFISSDLPLLIIDTNGEEIVDEPRIIAHLGIIDNGPIERNYLTDTFNGYDGQISIEIRGASSQSFPKKNYGFETQNSDGTNNNVSLLGMPAENDWILHGPFSDKSLMRNSLSYQFVRNMGQYAPRTRSCELVINGEYMGYYILVERIKRDENRLDIANVKPEDIEGNELSGGYIIQIDRDNPDLIDGWYSDQWPFNFYAFNDPDYDEINPIQSSYIRNFMVDFENAMATSDYASTYENWVDVESFIDYVLANEIAKHIDAYRLSFYMHKKKDSNGGKLHLGPIWDINLGYANFDYGCNNSPAGWSFDWQGGCALQATWVQKIATIPTVRNRMQCRWEELREDVLATSTLLNYIDDKSAEIAEAQVRNFQRFPVLGEYVWPNSFVGTTYQSEVDFLKNWLTDRLSWMDENINGDCSLVTTKEEHISDFSLQIFPNPFVDELKVLLKSDQFENGEIILKNVLGQVVFQQKITANQVFVLTTNFLENGSYFYEIWVNNEKVKVAGLVKI